MSDSVELRYLKQPPDPSVSAPDHEDNHNSRQCKPFEPPVPAAMSTVDRRKRQSPVVPKPDPENLPCPRCNSANTKFCYYNNNKLSQPRYFCRACRRYWTKGGILRDIPEGSGIARRYGRRSRRRTDLGQVAQDCDVLTAIDPEAPVAAVCEAPADVSSEGDQKVRFEESFGEPFLNGWLLGSREQGSEVSGSAGFEEMGFGRPV